MVQCCCNSYVTLPCFWNVCCGTVHWALSLPLIGTSEVTCHYVMGDTEMLLICHFVSHTGDINPVHWSSTHHYSDDITPIPWSVDCYYVILYSTVQWLLWRLYSSSMCCTVQLYSSSICCQSLPVCWNLGYGPWLYSQVYYPRLNPVCGSDLFHFSSCHQPGNRWEGGLLQPPNNNLI
jgi:hypothetical protein